MKRLRHPIRAIREPFGTAGLIVACLALVLAMGGAAVAANGGLTGKQKKEVEKIAKKFAGKPGMAGSQGPAGSKGDTGAVGANGAAGVAGGKGDTGAEGKQGKAGTNGASPEVVELQPDPTAEKCKNGGAEIIGAANEDVSVCNGEDGGGGGEGFPETLPSGKAEFGLWEVQGENGIVQEPNPGEVFVSTVISFPIPLASAPTEQLIITSASTTEEIDKCPGNPFEPKAASGGVFCIYPGTNGEGEPLPRPFGLPGKYGVRLVFPEAAKAAGTGSWAVKAP